MRSRVAYAAYLRLESVVWRDLEHWSDGSAHQGEADAQLTFRHISDLAENLRHPLSSASFLAAFLEAIHRSLRAWAVFGWYYLYHLALTCLMRLTRESLSSPSSLKARQTVSLKISCLRKKSAVWRRTYRTLPAKPALAIAATAS